MAFSRQVAPRVRLEGKALTAAMVGIGMGFVGRPNRQPNIEDVLLFASELGVDGEDFRILSVLTAWVGIHGDWVNADRLTRLVLAHPSERFRRYWTAIAFWRATDPRFKRLRALLGSADRQPLLAVGNEFQVSRRGEDPRFDGGPLVVPAGVLRERTADVVSPGELARRHRVYRERIVQGPSYRADMWALLAKDPTLSTAELARRAYGSFATAQRVKREWELLDSAAA